MSINLYDKTSKNLTALASGSRIWCGTKADYDATIAADKMPNNCLIAITDDETEMDTVPTEGSPVAVTSDGLYQILGNKYAYVGEESSIRIQETVTTSTTVADEMSRLATILYNFLQNGPEGVIYIPKAAYITEIGWAQHLPAKCRMLDKNHLFTSGDPLQFSASYNAPISGGAAARETKQYLLFGGINAGNQYAARYVRDWVFSQGKYNSDGAWTDYTSQTITAGTPHDTWIILDKYQKMI